MPQCGQVSSYFLIPLTLLFLGNIESAKSYLICLPLQCVNLPSAVYFTFDGDVPKSSAHSVLTDLLRRLKGRLTIVLIEHDMEAVFSLADRISVLVYGKIIATDTPQAIRDNPEVRTAYLGEETA